MTLPEDDQTIHDELAALGAVIDKLLARVEELEDDVHDLKGMVYMGESPGV